jgi:hypothetical protein
MFNLETPNSFSKMNSTFFRKEWKERKDGRNVLLPSLPSVLP